MKKVLDLKRQNKCKRLLSCLLTTDMQRLCLLWHYWKTLPFLSTPQVNNATFQRINFVKLKFIWISIKIFKKNKYVTDINIGACLLFLRYTERIIFFYTELPSLHDFPRGLLSNLLTSLLNYPRYWFLSILRSPFLKCFYSLAIAGSIVWLDSYNRAIYTRKNKTRLT